MSSLYNNIINRSRKNQKQFAVLIDPDNCKLSDIYALVKIAEDNNVDYFFVGGSLTTNRCLAEVIDEIKEASTIPTIIFPGHPLQIYDKADAILFLSLISGRNPEMLIGNHVIAAPVLKDTAIEVIPTGYILIDGGNNTSVEYMSNTKPIPDDKISIAISTAVAGELLGLNTIYMDAGSGAMNPISTNMIKGVKEQINIPLIIGGGINSPEKAFETCDAGADVLVVGNAIEKDQSLISEISDVVHSVTIQELK
ncbi:MAG: geranylgeranylglyceryl/heptaprenylglyceryl phosphate synthase [Bacteroidia bacterium]|nr:geranylgeranylglyceryl/heptaprenylglyceryl phosphate synthase [Bacteroidia bacterium]